MQAPGRERLEGAAVRRQQRRGLPEELGEGVVVAHARGIAGLHLEHLAFCSGVSHATHVAEEFRRCGISCATIFGDTPKDERDRIIAEFKAGKIRALAVTAYRGTGCGST